MSEGQKGRHGGVKQIESRENKTFKRLNGLKNRRNREKEGLFLAEGERFVSEIPKGKGVEYFVLSETFCETHDSAQYEAAAKTLLLPDVLFDMLCDTETPQGVLAVCKKLEWQEDEVFRRDKPFLLLAENLQDPGNLGTVIRTADACGADAVFLSKGSVDLYNPKVLRATMGSLFHIPVFQNVSLEETAGKLRKKGIPLYAAHLRGEDMPYALNLQNACAFLIGNEGRGLSEKGAALCSQWVRIPMPGHAESLNASVAAAVLLYETVRQRISGNISNI